MARATTAKNIDRDEVILTSLYLSRLASAEISALATYLEAHKADGQPAIKRLLLAWFKTNVT